MRLIKTNLVFLVFMALITLVPISVSAEIIVQDTDIFAEIYPIDPGPYSDATITLSSYATDLNKAMIEWQSGSKIILSGYGKNKYSFKTLGPNSPISFLVTILPAGSVKKVSKVITVTPSDVQLLWQAVDSYTPPFYRGKSFPSSEGLIKVVAMPNTIGTNNNKNKMTYTWKIKDVLQQSSSGFSKDSITFKNDNMNAEENVSVRISSINESYNSSGSVIIPIINPKIIFYKKSPTEGVLYGSALNDETLMTEEEMTVVAEPYFLALKGSENNFNYSWKINGSDIDTPTRKTELTVRPSSRGGYATISFTLENIKSLFQKVTSDLRINL